MVHQLLLGDLWLLNISQRIEEQLGADGILSGITSVLFELLAGQILSSKHLLEDLLIATKLANQLLDLALNLLVHDGLRQWNLGVLQRSFQNAVTDLTGLGVLQLILDLGLQGILQLFQRVEFGRQLCEVVIQLRELALLDGLNLDGDLSLFVSVLASDQLGGEGGFLARLHASQGVIQTLDQGIVANLVGQALGGGFINGLAVDGGGQVDGNEVALLDLAVNALQGAETSLEILQLLFDCSVINVEGINFDGDLGEVWDVNLRTDVNLSGEGDGLAILQFGDFNIRLAESLDVMLLNRLAVARWQHLVDNLVEDNPPAETSFQNLCRDLALTEARHINLLAQGGIRLVELRLELVEGYLDGDLGAGSAQVLNRALHGCTLLCVYRY